jgi:hypothetical protein
LIEDHQLQIPSGGAGNLYLSQQDPHWPGKHLITDSSNQGYQPANYKSTGKLPSLGLSKAGRPLLPRIKSQLISRKNFVNSNIQGIKESANLVALSRTNNNKRSQPVTTFESGIFFQNYGTGFENPKR